jgi:hypothetical protein
MKERYQMEKSTYRWEDNIKTDLQNRSSRNRMGGKEMVSSGS